MMVFLSLPENHLNRNGLVHRGPITIDFGGTRQSGISVWAYVRLRERLGLRHTSLPQVFDVFQMLAEIEQDVAEQFGSDCIALNRPSVAFGIRNEQWKPWVFPDGLRAQVPGGFNPEPDGAGGLVLKRNETVIAAMPAASRYFGRVFFQRPHGIRPL
jgi:hypothetical protein